MAPERVHSIIALDLTITDGVLHGVGERIEMSGEPIFVTWYAADPPDGHVSILNGLLQVPESSLLERTEIRDVQPADLGEGRHLWRDPPPENGPLMFAVILPPGYTIRTPSAHLMQAKVHFERIAVFWILPEGSQVSLMLHLAAAVDPIAEEVQRLNREALDQMVETRPGAGFQYDVALSFAGEDRSYVEQVAESLRDSEIRVFYDRFEEAALWGVNLYDHLSDIYRNRARYTVMFISKHYVEKVWTSHERQSAQARALTENAEYILPARFDDSAVPGLPDTVGYLPLDGRKPEDVAALIVAKLREA